MSLNNNLRHLIKENNLKIKEISDKSNVDRSTIHKLINGENKNPRLNTVKALAKYFNTTIDDLIR